MAIGNETSIAAHRLAELIPERVIFVTSIKNGTLPRMNPSTVRSLLSNLGVCLTTTSILSIGVREGLIRLRAQSIPLPALDAAPIKPSVLGNLRGLTFEFLPGGVRIINGTLIAILETAYEVREFQTLGGPSWVTQNATVRSSAPSIFTALQETLGPRLDPSKAQLTYRLCRRPSEN
jgi:hypothetical protein